MEEIWVRGIADLVWESVRLRCLKSQLLHAAAHEGLDRVLTPLIDRVSAGQLSRKWASGDDEAAFEVERLLGRAGLTIDAVMAQTLAARIDDVERIDRMVIIAEVRRDAMLREIRSRRLAFGQAPRRPGHRRRVRGRRARTGRRMMASKHLRLPPPLWGRVWGGGSGRRTWRCHTRRPPPPTLPHKGRGGTRGAPRAAGGARGSSSGVAVNAGIGAGVSSGISKRKLRANRLGKPAGSGPTSATGKARSAQNARKHGLSLAVYA